MEESRFRIVFEELERRSDEIRASDESAPAQIALISSETEEVAELSRAIREANEQRLTSYTSI